MKKKLLFLVIIIAFIICSAEYEQTGKYTLIYSNGKLKENIIVNYSESVRDIADQLRKVDGGFVEVGMVYGEVPATPTKTFSTKISKDGKTVTLTSEFEFSSFIERKSLFNCFENYDLYETDKYYYLNLKDRCYCTYSGFDTFNFKYSDIGKIEVNADKKTGNIYSWNVKEYGNNIEIKIYKTSQTVRMLPYYIGFLLIVGVIVLAFYLKSKSVNRI